MVTTIDNEAKVAINIRNVPATLRNRFKAFCVERELTMEGMFIAFMERTLARKSGSQNDLQQSLESAQN